MSAGWVESIKRRAADEASRTEHPADFPALPPVPPVPARRYSDAAFAALEDDSVWGRSWLMVAHVDEVPSPGSYRVLDQLAQPVLLVRGQDGEIRAFYTTCKLRPPTVATHVPCVA